MPMARRIVFIRSRLVRFSIRPISVGFAAPIRSSTAPKATPTTIAIRSVVIAQSSCRYIINDTGIAAAKAARAKR